MTGDATYHSPMNRRLTVCVSFVAAVVVVAACAKKAPRPPAPERLDEWTQQFLIEFGRQPDSAPGKWSGLIGEYGPDTNKRWFTIERDRRLWILDHYKNYA